MSLHGIWRGLSIAAAVIGLLVVAGGASASEGEGPATDVAEVPRTGGPQDMKVENPEPLEVKKAPDVKLPKEAQLRERVQARWDAVIKGDFDKAYGYETPEYRKTNTEQDFKEQFGRRVRWHVATLKDIRYDRSDQVEAIITLDYSFALPGGDDLARTTGDISERWVYSEGQWWRQDTPRPLGGKMQSEPSLQQ